MMQDLRMILFWSAVAGFAAGLAFGQAVNGTIVGTVTDSSGAAIAGVTVTLVEMNTGVIHTGQANSSGFYSFPDLPPGTYKLTAEMAGFKKALKTGVLL